MGSGLTSRKKKNGYKMPSYLPTKDDMKAYTFCVRNNIRISPIGINGTPGQWKIGINIGSYKRGEKINIAPNIYDKDTVWLEYYKFCKYYYDKYRK